MKCVFLGKGSYAKVYRLVFNKDQSVVIKVSKNKGSEIYAEYTILSVLRKCGISEGIPQCLSKIAFDKGAAIIFADSVSRPLDRILYHDKSSINFRSVFKQVFRTLHACVQKCNVFHCDIKPNNVVVNADMQCTVIDWGGAYLAPAIHKPSVSDPAAVRTTMAYSSPEVVAIYCGSRKTSYNPELLMTWSLGVFLYELYFRKILFQRPKEELLPSGIVGASKETIQM
ncbi:serine/threonine-protein kinase KDX1-like [Ixodes scapularis]|uniref:serine/threonine-protein kinase KDX1-like n=1 Tax=Ixodes scapularis TaxID=6945 RepID=UPI001A9D4838|nr:serine/threonine-protein kinase KDX1-like [Ixodes scapularis]